MGTITTKDGTEIFYKDWGKGQPIVFSHGWPLSSDDWDAQMLFFVAEGFRVVAHDRRGHGRSTQVSDGHERRALRGHEDTVRAAIWSPGEDAILTASNDRTARLWDVRTGLERLVFRGHGGNVDGAAFSPDGENIATFGESAPTAFSQIDNAC